MTDEEQFLGELRLGRQITTVRQLIAGSLVLLLGCLFLIADRSLTLVGGSAGVASLVAVLILGLSLLSVLELLAGSGEGGGSSTLIRESLGSVSGFLSGWALVAASAALSAGLAVEGARHLILLFPGIPITAEWIAVSLIVILILLQLFRTLPSREFLWAAFLLLSVGFFIGLLSTLGVFSSSRFDASRTSEFTDVLQAAAWMMIGYVALDSILNLRRQIQQPMRVIPTGLIVSLVALGLIFSVPQMIVAGLPESVADEVGIGLTRRLSEMSVFPPWLMDALLLLLFWLAASVALMGGARQLHRLSRQGALPATVRRLFPRFRIPPLLFTILLLICLPLILWGNLPWMVDLAAGMYLFTLILLNVTAIVSRQREPERRRLITLPLSPLIPGIAIAVSLALIFALSLSGILSGALWLGIGLIFYMIYGRSHLIDAQSGISVFGPDPDSTDEESAYRILLPLGMGFERHFMLELGTALAKQANGKLIPMQVVTIADPLAVEEGRRIAQERNTLFQWSTKEAAKSGVPTYPITRLARSVAEGIVDTAREEDCDLILMSWRVGLEPGEARMGSVLAPVVRTAPCDLAVVAVHPPQWKETDALERESELQLEPVSVEDGDQKEYRIRKILVPTAGGPHAPLATQLAVMLAREYNATATAVNVVRPDASEDDLKQAEARIQSTLEAMKLAEAEFFKADPEALLELIPVGSEVVQAASVVEGIAEAAGDSDLVLVGASEESVIDQVLFGSVPEEVAKLCPTPVVMVKRFRGLPRFWLQRVWSWISDAVPTLANDEQVNIYKQIRRGARPDVDFFVMIGLSAIIATFGLLQDSVAVIIGAMLVAPLFTPMMAISLSLVLGDLRLFRLAIEATLKGAALAVGLAVGMGVLIPLENLGPEILTRTQPNLLDLGVALASGAAGAYAVARKDVAASLPGVAIAAALLPPLSVVGIGLAFGEIGVAAGGSLLFITNLIAIAFSGALVFLLLGFRPASQVLRETRLRWGMAATITLLILISIPLATVFVQAVRESYLRQVINETLQDAYGQDPAFDVLDTFVEEGDEFIQIIATIRSSDPITFDEASEIQAALSRELEQPVSLRLVAVPLTEIDLPPP